ncbi:TPA: efflux RND transporter periplasmic adaptor subunit [Burkholderia vietnamiensis]|uniref:efflux RND transporter periplasmic adaptor subunit n=1 Tax=Burkholderia TaxID=32008 RepID=UPI0015EE5D49|nr:MULTISPECIES: efflux RND transporter periplasmic adaptor subunit [Burkholderia]MBR8035854.1 efflux RND transporter periplasmic adaptor subunit [Burkholderia vietnamiensis]MBR8164137.1 efflux RND transporter periplasmic adaptor subunit [Burkholderia vietnamiensis]MCA8149533.1 efflux RND transporter periplasmic adaptor subunit [Burkholderia vietnamiensis]MEC4600227.1 efflux RND transporter periplasmic adaptor subunit [Burkholderia vietnamiensis]QMI44121.1 efflux RND transporter periplasmic ad
MPEHNLDKLKIDRRPLAPAPLRRRWVRYAAAAALVAAAIAAALVLTSRPTVDTTSVTTAYPYQNDTQLNATGYVVPQRKAAVASKGQGRVEWLGVLEGTRVKKGDIIARLESRDVEASLAQARAQVLVSRANLGVAQAELKDAEIALRRTAVLAPKGAVPAAQLDIDTARVNKARATLGSDQAAIASAEANAQAAQVAVDQTVIRAPFDGIVLAKHANVGDNITPFSSASDSKGAVVTIADMDTLEVEADVAESNIAKIRSEQPCEIQLDALPDMRFAGRVSRIVPTVDRSKATVLVKVRFVDRDARVLPDMSAKIAFLSKPATPQDRQPVTAVQASAVVERDGRPVVFVVQDDAVHARAVTRGARIGELVAIGGVKPGDTVVLAPEAQLKDGAHVTVAKK